MFVAAVAIVAAAAGAAWLVREQTAVTPGPLTTQGTDGTGFTLPTGRMGSWGTTVIFNGGDKEATLDAIRPLGVRAGLEIVEVLVAGPDRRAFWVGNTTRWPSPDLSDLHPVRGATVAPVESARGDRGVEIVVVLRGREPGKYVLSELELDYRVGGRRHRRVIEAVMAVCVGNKGTEPDGYCVPPAAPPPE